MTNSLAISSVHRQFLRVLWQSKDDDGNSVPLTTSEISDRINRLRDNLGLPALSSSAVGVTIIGMREKQLLDVYRLNPGGRPKIQVSEEEIKSALAKARDRLTAYGARISAEDAPPEDDDSRWIDAVQAFRKKLDESLLGEPYSLRAVFVPPIGYWIKETPDDRVEVHRVVRILPELNRWVKTFNPADNVRVLVGGPGAGKSSTARIFAAKQIKAGRKVVFVQLHRLDLNRSIVAAFDAFAAEASYPAGLLDPEVPLEPLLIVADGLDELAYQGEKGTLKAMEFAERVFDALEKCHRTGRVIQMLFCGRPIAVDDFKRVRVQPRQILHLLPFWTPTNKRGGDGFRYEGKIGALVRDYRDVWWRRYAHAMKMKAAARELPDLFKDEKLVEFTQQPLLLFLLVIAHRDADKPSPVTGDDPAPPNPFAEGKVPERMADVFAWLLRKVFDRDYEKRFKHVESLSFADFRDVMALFGLTAWHAGDTRTASVSAARQLAAPMGLESVLDEHAKVCREGMVGLFLAFYFRNRVDGGRETFEFTIKPFAEYLTAAALVNALAEMANKLGERKNPTVPRDKTVWEAKELALPFLQIAGPGTLDDTLDRYVREEVARRKEHEQADVVRWRTQAVKLFEYVQKERFPAELLKGASFQKMSDDANRAEYTLLQLIGACQDAAPLPDMPPPAPELQPIIDEKLDWSDCFTSSEKARRRLDALQQWYAANPDCVVRIAWPTSTSAAEMLRRIRRPWDRYFWHLSPPPP